MKFYRKKHESKCLIELDTFLIKPIRNFSEMIKSITSSQDLTKRVEVNDNIKELDSIQKQKKTHRSFGI